MAAVDPFVDGGYRAAMEVGGAIGRHRWWADGDVLRIAYHGEVEREHVAALFGVFDEFLAMHGYLLVLIDLRDAGGMRPAARRLLGEHRQDRERSSVGFFGVGPVPRLFMGLISSSMRLLGREPLHLCVAGSEAAALAWLGRERERHRTTLPVKGEP